MQRSTLIIICILIAQAAAAQVNIQFILKSDRKIDTVDVFDLSQQEFYSSPYKDTLAFTFKKDIINCYNFRYHQDGKMYFKQIWLDTGSMIVKAHTVPLSLVIDTVINSPFYYSVADYNTKFGELNVSNVADGLSNFLLDRAKQEMNTAFFYKIAYDYITVHQKVNNDLSPLKDLIAEQKTDFSWFWWQQFVVGKLDKLLETKNIKFADFDFAGRNNNAAVPHLDGAKYFILDFWFVGCPACVAQHKEIKANFPKLKEKNIAVIGISTDKNSKDWNNYLSRHGYTWDNYREAGTETLSKKLGIQNYPEYVVINKNGDVVGTYDSFSDAFKGTTK